MSDEEIYISLDEATINENFDILSDIENDIWYMNPEYLDYYIEKILTFLRTNVRMGIYILESISNAFLNNPRLIVEYGRMYQAVYGIAPYNKAKYLFEHYLYLEKTFDYQIRTSCSLTLEETLEIYSDKKQRMIFDDDFDSLYHAISNDQFSISDDFNLRPLCPGELSLINAAARFNAPAIFKFIYMNHTLINEETLYNAVLGGNLEIIRIVMQTVTNTSKAMKAAIISHRTDIMQFLIENFDQAIDPGDALEYGNTKAFCYAYSKYAFDYLTYLQFAGLSSNCFAFEMMLRKIQKKTMLNFDTLQNIFIGICKGGSMHLFKLFFKNFGFRSYVNGAVVCAKYDNFEILSEIIKKDKKVALDQNCINYACLEGSYRCIELLLKNGADITLDSIEATMRIGSLKCFELIFSKYMEKFKNRVGKLTVNSMNELMTSIASNDNVDFMNIYLKYSSDYWNSHKLLDPYQFLNLAALYNSPNIMRELFSLGYKPGSYVEMMMSCLKSSSLECLKILVENGANVNEVNAQGYTVLMHSLLLNNVEFVSYLLSINASVWIKNKYGETCYKMARIKEFKDLKIMILESIPRPLLPLFYLVESQNIRYAVIFFIFVFGLILALIF